MLVNVYITPNQYYQRYLIHNFYDSRKNLKQRINEYCLVAENFLKSQTNFIHK